MAENNGLSVSDVAALSGGGFGGFGNGFEGLIYLAVIAAMFGGGFGFGGFGNGAGAAVATGMATQADMQRGFDQQNTMAQTRDILAAVTGGTAQTIAASTANATNAINANTTAQTQKILDAIMGNRMAEMSAQISQLQLQNAMAGVMRFPSGWAYNGGYFPPMAPATGTAAG